MGKKSEKVLSALVVSYIPLLTGDPGFSLDLSKDPDKIKEFLDAVENETPDCHAAACVWVLKDDFPSPVFCMENAHDILDHLEWWSEEKPVDWFNLLIREQDKKYVIALVPKLNKSIERWNIAYQLRTGFPPPKETRYSILYRALHFVSGGQSAFDQVKDKIGPEIMVGFIDMKDMNQADPSQTDFQKTRWIGPFPVHHNDELFNDYLDSILKDAKKP